MKKIILFICLLVLPINVVAKDYYLDYEEYKIGVKEELDESDTLKKEEYFLYNTYDEAKVYDGFNDNCDLYEKDDYIIERIYSNKKFNEDDIENVAFLDKYDYIDYFSIYKNYKEINIKEIIITQDGEKINYSLSSSNKDINLVSDNDLNTSILLTTNESIKIIFDEKQDIKNLSIKVLTDDDIYINILSRYYDEDGMSYSQNHKTTYKNYMFLEESEWSKIEKDDNYVEGKPIINYFYYKDVKKYNCYHYKKVKTNNYVREGNNLIKDDYIKMYNYYERIKISLKDELNTNFDILSLIENTTKELDSIKLKEEYEIINNGIYKIDILINDKYSISHTFKLNKPLEKVLANNITTTNKIITSTSTTKRINKTTTKKINELIIDETEDEILKVDFLKGEIKEDKINNNYIFFIPILIFLIIVFTFIVLRKMKNKN